jgi:hypothetical protein
LKYEKALRKAEEMKAKHDLEPQISEDDNKSIASAIKEKFSSLSGPYFTKVNFEEIA